MNFFYYRLFVGSALTDFNVLDYSNSRLITIQTGIARIQNGTFKIIHSIDLEQYRTLSNNIESVLNTNITYNHPFRPFLTQQVSDIEGLLKRLNPSVRKRSIDFIGSAWKWVAGTPDSHDFEILSQKVKNVLENNNRQMIINDLTVNRIQEISNMTNEISKIKREDWNDKLAGRLQHELNFIEKELQNIEYAIQWAKVNIVNSFILSKTEIENLNNILETYNIPIFNIDELLAFADVKIVTNNKEILYILSIPITHDNTCKVLIARPVKIGSTIDKIEFNKILECNGSLFAIKNDCKSFNNMIICNKDKLVELRENNCITSLIKNRIGNCTQVNNDHIPAIEDIGSDLLLLNQYNGKLKVNEEEIALNGTYLIKYHNTTIQIEGQEFYSKEISGNKPLPAFLQPKSTSFKTEEVLSLERLSKINIGNIKRLEQLEDKNKWFFSSSGLLIISILSAICWIVIRQWKNKKTKVKEILSEQPADANIPKANHISSEVKAVKSNTEKKNWSIYDLHTF